MAIAFSPGSVRWDAAHFTLCAAPLELPIGQECETGQECSTTKQDCSIVSKASMVLQPGGKDLRRDRGPTRSRAPAL